MAQSTQTLGNSAFERIKAMILDGALEPGTLLREKKIADRLGVSRTPIREAIGLLISEGFATRSAGGAPTVASVTLVDIMEILHARNLLESEAARKAAISGKSFESLLALKGQIEGYLEGPRPDSRTHSTLDTKLHLEIAGLAGSRLLAELIEGLKNKTGMFDQGLIPDRFLPGCHEHVAIIDAITAKNPEEAAAAMKLHLSNVRSAIIAHIHHSF